MKRASSARQALLMADRPRALFSLICVLSGAPSSFDETRHRREHKININSTEHGFRILKRSIEYGFIDISGSWERNLRWRYCSFGHRFKKLGKVSRNIALTALEIIISRRVASKIGTILNTEEKAKEKHTSYSRENVFNYTFRFWQ